MIFFLVKSQKFFKIDVFQFVSIGREKRFAIFYEILDRYQGAEGAEGILFDVEKYILAGVIAHLPKSEIVFMGVVDYDADFFDSIFLEHIDKI